MNESHRAAAEHILRVTRHNFQPQTQYREAAEADFPHLRMADYAAILAQLEALGYRLLVDHENLTVSATPNSVIARTMIRRCTSADGAVLTAHYQVRPVLSRRLRLLLRGLLNLRWIAAPADFLKNLRTRNCVDFETELSDGSFVVTTSAKAAGLLSSPPTIDQEYYPYDHPVDQLHARHLQRIEARLGADAALRVVPVGSVEQALTMQARMQAVKAAYRQAVGWVTRAEARGMSGGRPDVADAVHRRIEELNRKP